MGFKRIEEDEIYDRGKTLAGALYHQINDLHTLNYRDIPQIEIEHLENMLEIYKTPHVYKDIPLGTIIFNPSGASKCRRELYYQFTGVEKDEQLMFPFQKRWTRNSTAVHEVFQKDFLYMEHLLDNPLFKIARTKEGKPAWEEHVKTVQLFEHNGVMFGLSGMMDGILLYTPENKNIGMEYKTKSNSVAQVGTFKLKDASPSHKLQCVSYSLMFPEYHLDEFIIIYEAVAKDNWMKGEEARIDVRTFYYKPTEEEKTDLLDKFSEVVKAVKAEKLPEKEPEKCLFCNYKETCGGISL